MIVNNLNFVWSVCRPPEANPELVINPDAPLAFAVAAQRFQPVAWRGAHVVQASREVELHQFTQCLTFNLRPTADMALLEQGLGIA